MRRLSRIALAALGVFAWGCERSSSAPVDKPAAAQQVVQRFFAALPEGNCAQLRDMLVLERPDRGCREVVAELNQHQMRLGEVLGAEVDGRDENAVIVRTRMLEGGKPKQAPVLLRVERHAGTWKIRL